jgi:hypothetical protein
MLGTFKEHVGTIQGTLKEHSRSIQETFICKEDLMPLHHTAVAGQDEACTVNIHVENSGNIQGTFSGK